MRNFSCFRLYKILSIIVMFASLKTALAEYRGVADVVKSTTKVLDSYFRLNSGHSIPVVGFGTYKIQGKEVISQSIEAALKVGYKLIDTAAGYGNEEDIGAALKEFLPKYGLKREDIFITSKLAPKDQGKDKVREAVESSLQKLGVDYIDLYLIHWPFAAGLPPDSPEHSRLRNESWQGLVALRDEGKLRSVGVSNYTPRHIRELMASSGTPPALNQVETHPHWLQPKELLEESAKVGTLIQAYSSLGGNRGKDLPKDPRVVSIAEKLKVQPAQLLLRWGLQSGFAVIPKSTTPERIEANTKLDFVISEEDMKILNDLNKNTKYTRDPEEIL